MYCLSEVKHIVEVKKVDKAQKVPQEILDEIKGVIGGKILTSMRKEVISCPIRGGEVPFLICFTCKNFIRRVSGKVHCKGVPLT